MPAEWTPERREQQREIARRGVEEGWFGGAGRGQGRPRKARASEKVAELVSRKGQELYDRLMEIVHEGKHADSLKAIRELRTFEEQERILSERETQNDIENMQRDQLLELVSMRLAQLEKDGSLGEIIEESTIAEYRAIEGNGDGPGRAEEETA